MIAGMNREDAAKLYDEWRIARDELDKAECDADSVVETTFSELKDKLRDEFRRRIEEPNRQKDVALGLADLRSKEKATSDAFDALEVEFLIGEDDKIIRCTKSDKPLLEGDEVVQDTESGEYFLRSEIGLPPRPVEKEDEAEAA
jgi:hypothetical protein